MSLSTDPVKRERQLTNLDRRHDSRSKNRLNLELRVEKLAAKRAHEMYLDRLREVSELAAANVMTRVIEGDVASSKWLIEHLRQTDGDIVNVALVNALETVGDVQEASRQAILVALGGGMSLQQLKLVQEALGRHLNVSGAVMLDDLRAEIATLRAENAKTLDGSSNAIPLASLPRWGGLKNADTGTEGELANLEPVNETTAE